MLEVISVWPDSSCRFPASGRFLGIGTSLLCVHIFICKQRADFYGECIPGLTGKLDVFIMRRRYASQVDFCSSLFTFSFLTQNDVMRPPSITVQQPNFKVRTLRVSLYQFFCLAQL